MNNMNLSTWSSYLQQTTQNLEGSHAIIYKVTDKATDKKDPTHIEVYSQNQFELKKSANIEKIEQLHLKDIVNISNNFVSTWPAQLEQSMKDKGLWNDYLSNSSTTTLDLTNQENIISRQLEYYINYEAKRNNVSVSTQITNIKTFLQNAVNSHKQISQLINPLVTMVQRKENKGLITFQKYPFANIIWRIWQYLFSYNAEVNAMKTTIVNKYDPSFIYKNFLPVLRKNIVEDIIIFRQNALSQTAVRSVAYKDSTSFNNYCNQFDITIKNTVKDISNHTQKLDKIKQLRELEQQLVKEYNKLLNPSTKKT